MLSMGALARLRSNEGAIPTWTKPPTVRNLSSNTFIANMEPEDVCIIIGKPSRETVFILTERGPCYIVAWALTALKVA